MSELDQQIANRRAKRESLRGRGMEYNSDSRVFTLMADVRGRFEPRK